MQHAHRSRQAARRALALPEVAAVLSVIALVLVLLPPMAGRARDTAMAAGSKNNLRGIGVMSGFYAGPQADAIPTYSWKANILYTVEGQDGPFIGGSDQEAQSGQNTDILRRLTGRVDGEDRLFGFSRRLAPRRYSHLVLADYFDWPATFSLFHAPGDVNLQRWAADPLDLSEGPYASAGSVPDGYEDDPNWRDKGVRQRWPYASSYQWVPAAWQQDGSTNIYAPVAQSPHLMIRAGFPQLGGRRFDQVAFPANKVFVHEEFQWSPTTDPGTGLAVSDGTYFAYPQARVLKLMFDGSVDNRPSREARAGASPADPQVPWSATYVPLDRFPAWRSAPDDRLFYYFRWTLGGLQGLDYPTFPYSGSLPNARRAGGSGLAPNSGTRPGIPVGGP